MSIVDLAVVKQSLRVVHDAEDDLIAMYVNGCEIGAAQFLNRAIFPTTEALTAARTAAVSTFRAALESARLALVAAGEAEELTERSEATTVASNARAQAVYAYRATMDGIVINDDIKVAILLMVGALWENRSDVIVGTIASQLPNGAQSRLFPYRVGMGV